MEASNIEEALKAASEWKAEGKYDWFRGQTHPWPLISTLGRLSEEGREETRRKLGRFYDWVISTPGLEPLYEENSFFAVAQHYGIPTNYIDFSTDPGVAGFFATHGGNLEAGQQCCIYCLNTKEIVDFWKSVVPPEYPQIEAIEISVPNLWRLEAQSGVFLYCPCDGLEAWYAPDRIVFPYSGPVSTPSHEDIYPTRKSSLEILLDQFFSSETSREGSARMRAKAKKFGWPITIMPRVHDRIDEYVLTESLNVLPSWTGEELTPWLYTERRVWQEAASTERCELEISFDAGPVELQEELEGLLNSRFAAFGGCRGRLINWSLHVRDAEAGRQLTDELQRGVNRIWDGMGILPYTYEDMAKSISAYVSLRLLWARAGTGRHETIWKNVFGPYLPDGIEVEFGSQEGAGARAVASRSKLLGAVRDDMAELVTSEHRDALLSDVKLLLQFITSPSKLFEFRRLRQLFVEELIPTQVVMYTLKEPVYFTPARLEMFGLP